MHAAKNEATGKPDASDRAAALIGKKTCKNLPQPTEVMNYMWKYEGWIDRRYIDRYPDDLTTMTLAHDVHSSDRTTP